MKDIFIPLTFALGNSAAVVNTCTWFIVTEIKFSCITQGCDPTLISISKKTLKVMRHGYTAFSVILQEKLPMRAKLERTPWDWEYLTRILKVFLKIHIPTQMPWSIPFTCILKRAWSAPNIFTLWKALNFHLRFFEKKFLLSLCISTKILKRNWEKLTAKRVLNSWLDGGETQVTDSWSDFSEVQRCHKI